jgi:hypothetical protein
MYRVVRIKSLGLLMLPASKISSRPDFDLSEYNINVVKAMVQFMYTGSYSFHLSSPNRKADEGRPKTFASEDDQENHCEEVDMDTHYEPCFHMMMYGIAENYLIDGLKSRAIEYFAASEEKEQNKDKFRERAMTLWVELPGVDDILTDKMFELIHRSRCHSSSPLPSVNGQGFSPFFSLPPTPPSELSE